MHELSVCLALVLQVEKIAREKNALAIDRIVVNIGPLSGIESDLLQRAYPLAAIGTLASDAELIIIPAVIVVRCSECGAESTVAPNRLLCSACGDFRTTLISGDEMVLQSLELRTDQRVTNNAMTSPG